MPLVEGTFTTMWRTATRADLKLRYSTTPAARILDVGAGGAPWAIAMLTACPQGSAVVNDLPGVLDVARRKTAEFGVADRCEFRPGDYFEIDVEPGAYDIVVLGHVCRAEGAPGAQRLIARAFEALKPGGRVVLADYFQDPERKLNPHAVLMGVTMMAATTNGFTYTPDEFGDVDALGRLHRPPPDRADRLPAEHRRDPPGRVRGDVMARQLHVTPVSREETDGLVPWSDSPMLQPWEVYDRELFDARDGARVRPLVGVARRHGGPPASRATSSPAGSAPNPCSWCVPRAARCGVPQQLPPPRLGAAVRSGRQLRVVDDVPVPQLELRPRRPPDRHTRPGAHVPRRASTSPSSGWCRSASRWHGTSSCSGACRSRAPSFRDWIAPIADRYDRYGSSTSPVTTATLDQEYPINWKAFAENSNDDYHVRFVHRRLNSQRKSLDTVVRFEGRTCSGYKPHPPEFDTSGGRTRPRPRGARRPLRRLHLPESHTAAVPDDPDPRAGRSDRARPDAAVLADLRHRPHDRASRRRISRTSSSPTARTPTW